MEENNTQKNKDNFIIKDTKAAYKYCISIIKWVVLASLTGALGGLVGTAFHTSISFVTKLRTDNPFLIYLLPVGGLVIALLYKLSGLENHGTDQVIDAVRSDKGVPFLLAPLIFVSTVITHLFGGSAGREGAALQLGGSIGSQVGRIFHLDEKDMHLIIMCGMSAVFSALFGTPITAALFAIEVISVGIMHYSAIVPCLLSSILSYWISLLFKVDPVRFHLSESLAYHVPDFFKVSVLSALCALLSIVFCVLMHAGHKYSAKWIKNPFIRIAVGGAAIIVLTLIFGRDYNGAGTQIIERAIGGEKIFPLAFALKMIFTMVTIGFGYKGGEIIPTFFIGASFGSVIGSLLGLDSGFAASIGLIVLFCSVVNCPIASIIMSVEIFGSDLILYFAVACSIGYALSGYLGLYSSQKIVYSKTKAEFINKNTIQGL